jgi:hypothetical protein
MVLLTVRVSEVDQFCVELPAATTTAGHATATLARLHNLRASIALLRAEGNAMAQRWRQQQQQEQEAGAAGGAEAKITTEPPAIEPLLEALADAEAAAFGGRAQQQQQQQQAPTPLTADLLRSHVARARAAADAAMAAAAAATEGRRAPDDAQAAFLRALEAAEADARSDEGCCDEGGGGGGGGGSGNKDAADQGGNDNKNDSNTPSGRSRRRLVRPQHPPRQLDPRAAVAWFCGRPLQPAEATLARLLGGGCAAKADRTRAVLRLSRDLAAGCPAKPGAMAFDGPPGGGGGGGGGGPSSADERRAMLAWCHKRQQELARLDEAARDGADDHCDAPWADPGALRRDLTGVGGGGVRWRF